MGDKDRFCCLSFKACWVNLARASMCATTSSRLVEGTNGGHMIVPVENRVCLLALRSGGLAALGN